MQGKGPACCTVAPASFSFLPLAPGLGTDNCPTFPREGTYQGGVIMFVKGHSRHSGQAKPGPRSQSHAVTFSGGLPEREQMFAAAIHWTRPPLPFLKSVMGHQGLTVANFLCKTRLVRSTTYQHWWGDVTQGQRCQIHTGRKNTSLRITSVLISSLSVHFPRSNFDVISISLSLCGFFTRKCISIKMYFRRCLLT